MQTYEKHSTTNARKSTYNVRYKEFIYAEKIDNSCALYQMNEIKKKIKKQNQKPTIKNLKRKNVVGIVYSCAALYTRTPTHWMRAMFVWLLYDIVIACFTMLNTCIHTFKMSCKATTFAINSNKRALLYCTFYVSTKKIKKSKSNTHRIKFAKWNLRAEWIEFYAVPQIMSCTRCTETLYVKHAHVCILLLYSIHWYIRMWKWNNIV